MCPTLGYLSELLQRWKPLYPKSLSQGTKQIIISLGATRTLTVGKTDYTMENGDVAIFGSSVHGVKREPLVTTGRISIALFVI